MEILDDQFLAVLPLVVPKRTTSVTRLVKSDAQRLKSVNTVYFDDIIYKLGCAPRKFLHQFVFITISHF